MKNTAVILFLCMLGIVACKDDPIDVNEINVSPKSTELLIGETLPTLVATVLPDNADDKTVVWSSSKPGLIKVDAQTGVLSFAVADLEEESSVVIITATSGAKSGTAEIKVKGKMLSITPKTAELFTDEALPTLTANIFPQGTAITWSSDKPGIIAVNIQTGALTFAVSDIEAQSVAVTITANAAGKSSQMTITVKGQISRYNIIDCTAELGLLVLDRNIGATAAYDPNASDNSAAVGNFYQWGKNIPVASSADAAANANFNAGWNADGADYKDWSVAENTPCPKGWSLPDKDQMKKIVDATYRYSLEVEFDMMNGNEPEIVAAKALGKKLLLPPTGAFRTADKKYLPKAPYLWSSYLNTADSPSPTGFNYAYAYSDNNDALLVKKEVVTTATPCRCVKEAE